MSDHVVVNSIPFSSRVVAHGAKNILAQDQARARKLLQGVSPSGPLAFQRSRRIRELRRGRHHHDEISDDMLSDLPEDPPASTGSVDVTDAAVIYTISVGVGSPPTDYTLVIDTGSSNTWVGANKPYVETSTSKSTGNTVHVTYGSGEFTGIEYTDTVSLGENLAIKNQSIGVASSSEGFKDVDGILGIGPVDLTRHTVANTTTVPTVTDNLLSQGTIAIETIGVSFVPTTSTVDTANGQLTFGGTDSTMFSGEINYVPITSTAPASSYWGIDQTLTYGDKTQLLKSSGIVDTGTTLLLLATDAFDAYKKATGAKLDNTTGLLKVTEAQFKKMKSMFFKIGDVTYEFTPNAQIWPRALNTALGGSQNGIYLITADMGELSGSGLDFINGFAFLQRFYSVYDTSNSRIGFANTPHTHATSN